MATEVVTRPATAAQWARALERAIDEALDVLVEPLSGQAFVESATTPGARYIVTASSCSCPAGERGIPCKHRACYLFQIGELPVEAAVETLETRACMWCFGSGRVPNDSLKQYDPCGMCGGTGQRVDHRRREQERDAREAEADWASEDDEADAA